jgi:hypothetical protein
MPSIDLARSNDLLGNSVANTGQTTIGAGQTFAVVCSTNRPDPRIYVWEAFFPGAAPASLTLNLEGSLDGSHWYTLDTTSSTTSAIKWLLDKPANYVRANLAAITTPGGGVIVRFSAL